MKVSIFHRKKTPEAILLSWLFPGLLLCQTEFFSVGLRLNEIQVIGSHNSYKEAIEPPLWKLLKLLEPSVADALQYEHLPLDEQLQIGLRGLELDVFSDPAGGRYSHPLGLRILQTFGVVSIPYDTAGTLERPGLKTLHQPDIDFRSLHPLFRDCLLELRAWSSAHKGHLPVMITMNAKDDTINFPGIVPPLPFTHDALHEIDREILGVFDPSQLITPDLVQGKDSTLESAILRRGWPRIDDVRGRFLFVLDETGRKLNAYLNQDGGLRGRVLFVNVTEGHPLAAVRIVNDPIRNGAYIRDLVRRGYLVRTRADADTKEARLNDGVRLRKAVESGAQVISTDYYFPSRLFPTEYRVAFSGGKYVQLDSALVPHPAGVR